MQKDVPARSLSSCPGIVDSLSKSIVAPPVSMLGGGGNGKSPEEVTALESCMFPGCSQLPPGSSAGLWGWCRQLRSCQGPNTQPRAFSSILCPNALKVRQNDDKLSPFPGNRNVLGVCTKARILHLLNSGIVRWELASPGRNELPGQGLVPRTRAHPTVQVQEGPAFLGRCLR